MTIQLQHQLDIARINNQHSAERERQHFILERLDTAYRDLGVWLSELDKAVRNVWIGVASDKEEEQARAKQILDQWPWDYLHPPDTTAQTRHLWSREVRELIGKFAGESSAFYSKGLVAWDSNRGPDRTRTDRPGATETWQLRGRLLVIIDEIRDQAKTELFEERPQTVVR